MLRLPNAAQVKPPFSYFGGKSAQILWLGQFLPPARKFVDVFGGSGAVLLSRPPAAVEVYNDLDPDPVNFYRVIRDPAMAPRLVALLRLTPRARREHNICRRLHPSSDPVERARQYFVLIRQSMSSIFGGSWVPVISTNTASFHNAIDLIAPAGLRMANVTITNLPFDAIFDREDGVGTLTYVDPPYLPQARVAPTVYRHEMSLADHERLLGRLVKLRAMAVVSGYPSALYDDALIGWHRVDKDVACASSPTTRVSGRSTKGRRTERLWINPQAWSCLASRNLVPRAGVATRVFPGVVRSTDWRVAA